MAFSNQLFFFLFALLLSISPISHSADLITKECGQTFTNNEMVQGNIYSVLSDLVTKTTSHGFANSTYGSGDDAVYGLAECRGDVTSPTCTSCIISAGKEIRTTCANTIESSIWYHQCFLRFSTNNFIGRADTTKLGVWTSSIKINDPNEWSHTLEELLGALGVAASNGEIRKFGWGEIENPNIKKDGKAAIYGMAYCTWDLQVSECLKCVYMAFNILQSECGEIDGCLVVVKSCAIRYESTSFLFLDGAAIPTVTTRKISFANI